MLGKQWLNRCDSTDMRGTAVERSQSRQRKLDGIVTWYFENVMESLPLMLQVALLLFGCALSRYLWEVNIAIASVALGVTSFGFLSYLFIVIAGTAFENCPYQTPGSHVLRYHLLPTLCSTSSKFTGFIKISHCYRTPIEWWERIVQPWYSISNTAWSFLALLCLPIALVADIYRLGRVIPRSLTAFGRAAYHRYMVTPLRTRDLDQHTITLDLRCVSWMLQTSLDKTFHLSALKYLAAMPEFVCFDPSLVIGCFHVLIGCVHVDGKTLVILQDLEELATLSARFFLRTFRHLYTMNPTSSTVEDLRQRYDRVFPSVWVDPSSLPFCYTTIATHVLVNQNCKPPKQWKWWGESRPSAQEQIQLAWCIAEAARVGYRQRRRRKVPRWTLRFALESLSLDPPPPPPVVADCLKIVAIDLGLDVSNFKAVDERCVRIWQITLSIAKNQCTGNFRLDNPKVRNHCRIFHSGS